MICSTCSLPPRTRCLSIPFRERPLAAEATHYTLTEEQDEEVCDGEGEEVVVGGGAHPGEAQDDAAHGQVAEDARDGHHCTSKTVIRETATMLKTEEVEAFVFLARLESFWCHQTLWVEIGKGHRIKSHGATYEQKHCWLPEHKSRERHYIARGWMPMSTAGKS